MSNDNNINLDFSKALIIETNKMEWTPSPLPGVDRRRLEREEAEAGRATSLVRYAPGSSFSSHVHGGGEEYFVLEGTFSDQSGDYGKGYYVRNPPGSSHAPYSDEGCTLFVKLCQMDDQGEPQVNLYTNELSWQKNETQAQLDGHIKEHSTGHRRGHSQIQLFKNDREHVQLEKLEPDTELHLNTGGSRIEILILEGSVEFEGKNLDKLSWIRLPKESEVVMSSKGGCQFWSKRGSI